MIALSEIRTVRFYKIGFGRSIDPSVPWAERLLLSNFVYLFIESS